jgi:hypothetical protein
MNIFAKTDDLWFEEEICILFSGFDWEWIGAWIEGS